jgi:uncharacterized membrane-anchored protein
MSQASQKAVLVAAFLLVAAVTLLAIRSHERTLAEGAVVLAALAPVDPRSLMQGDYMALRFAIDDELPQRRGEADARIDPPPIFAYLAVDGEGRASLAGVGDSLTPPVAGQVAMRIRWRGGHPSIGPNAYFFQEGTAERFAAARWGEFRVNPNGSALLTQLRDARLDRL